MATINSIAIAKETKTMANEKTIPQPYVPQKAMVAVTPDGTIFEGDTYEEIVIKIYRDRHVDYTDAERETQFHLRADLAEGWELAAKMVADKEIDVDPTTTESLIVSAAKAGYLELYDNKAVGEQ
jgi:hypothetical protein